MLDIIPAILPQNYEDLKNKIALVRDYVDLVQIDICDGVFVPSTTWPFGTSPGRDLDAHFNKILNEEEGLPFWEDLEFELDLMVADAVENFDIYAKLGAKRLIFHIEAVGDITEFKNFLEGIDMYQREMTEIGIAINIDTPNQELDPLINNIDFVQCMGIAKIGYQGESFDDRVLEKIENLKKKYPDLLISVDGAVSLETAPALIEAGATRLASGSAILNAEDIVDELEKFRNLL